MSSPRGCSLRLGTEKSAAPRATLSGVETAGAIAACRRSACCSPIAGGKSRPSLAAFAYATLAFPEQGGTLAIDEPTIGREQSFRLAKSAHPDYPEPGLQSAAIPRGRRTRHADTPNLIADICAPNDTTRNARPLVKAEPGIAGVAAFYSPPVGRRPGLLLRALRRQSECPAFTRPRACSGRRQATDQRPRFHEPTGLPAQIRPSPQFAISAPIHLVDLLILGANVAEDPQFRESRAASVSDWPQCGTLLRPEAGKRAARPASRGMQSPQSEAAANGAA